MERRAHEQKWDDRPSTIIKRTTNRACHTKFGLGAIKKRKLAVLVATALCVLLISNVVYALNSADLDKLRTTNQCAQCDLSGAPLTGLNAAGRDLDASDLSGADLSGADLSGADVSGANLSNANLSSANLSGMDLSGSDLSGADLTGANLSGTNLDGTKLDNAVWTDGKTCKAGSTEKCEH